MAELEELEQEEMNKRMRDVRLPSVPSTSLPSRPGKLLACHFKFLMIMPRWVSKSERKSQICI